MSDLNTVESVARRYAASRPGCRFVGPLEVGIAVYVLDLQVIAVEAEDIPLIDQFLLKSLQLGIDREDQLSLFLGLDQRTVRNRLVELSIGEFVTANPSNADAPAQCRLTAKGKKIVATMQQHVPKEVTLSKMAYHGFTRRLLAIDTGKLLLPRELRERGIPEIPAIPNRYPRPDEINLNELSNLMKATRKGSREQSRRVNIINVRSVQKNVRTWYQPAVLLQFERAGVLRQRIVTFAIDGVEDKSLERAFDVCGGQDRIPDLLAAQYQSTADLAHEHLFPKQVERLGELNDVDELVDRLSSTEGEIEQKASEVQKADAPDTRQLLKAEIDQLRTEKVALEVSLNNRKGRKLRTYDCKRVLSESLAKAKERLVIVSAFISTAVVDHKFLVALEDVLKRGVKVWIVYGLHDEIKSHRYDWRDAATSLSDLRKRYKDQFFLLDHGQVHSKWLICDSDFVAVGSFNWLSFRGDQGRSYRHEHALMVTEPATIEEWVDETRGLFPQSP